MTGKMTTKYILCDDCDKVNSYEHGCADCSDFYHCNKIKEDAVSRVVPKSMVEGLMDMDWAVSCGLIKISGRHSNGEEL